MKTTLDIADSLMVEARKLAAREGMTLRALVERGLRNVLAEKQPNTPYRLRDVSFKGKGLQPGVRDGDWSDIRARIYEGRGG